MAGKLQGYVEQGGNTASVAGFTSTTKEQKSFPGATVTVYLTGTVTLATIYSDTISTAKANPFTAGTDGLWEFFASAGRYDVKFSGTGITTPWTLVDLPIIDVSSSSGFINVRSAPYNAVGDGVTDDGAAIRAAATVVNAAGGGTLWFPPGDYFVYPSGQVFVTLQNFNNCDGLEILGYGATITVDPARVMPTAEGSMFAFANSSNIKIDGLRIVGPTTSMVNINGIEAFRFNGGVNGIKNIDIPNLYVEGMAGAITLVRVPATDAHIENVHIGNLYAKSTFYAINGQYTGINVTVDNLRTDKVHRSFYFYGAKNLKADIISTGSYASDVLFANYQGYGVENVWINYTMGSTATVNSTDAAQRVQLQYADQTPGLFRNINLNFNVVWGVGVGTGGSLFLIRKYLNDNVTVDTVDRGHILDGLTISGYVEGDPNYVGLGLTMGTDPTAIWGTGDFWYNIAIRDFHFKSSTLTNGPFFQLGSLLGGLRLENFYSDKYCRFIQSVAALRPPRVGQYSMANAIFPNRDTHINASIESMNVITMATGGTDTIYSGWSGHVIKDGGSNVTATLPVSVAGLEYQFQKVTAVTFRVDPNGAEVIRGGGAGKYLQLTAQGDAVHLCCYTAGTWDIVSSNGAFTFEP